MTDHNEAFEQIAANLDDVFEALAPGGRSITFSEWAKTCPLAALVQAASALYDGLDLDSYNGNVDALEFLCIFKRAIDFEDEGQLRPFFVALAERDEAERGGE